MGQKEVEELFLENPGKEYYLRQIARLTKTPKTSVSRILSDLIKNKIVKRKKDEPFDKYLSNSSDNNYVFRKKIFILEKIHYFGLLEFINNEIFPTCIILFGSCAKGEYNQESDIDLFVQTNEQKINLKKYEKKLKHKINIIFEPKINNLSKELKNNILNGIKLSGTIRLKEKKES